MIFVFSSLYFHGLRATRVGAKSLADNDALACAASDASKLWPSAKKPGNSVQTRVDSQQVKKARFSSLGNASDARVLGQLALLVGDSRDNSQEVSRRVAGG